MINKLQEYLLVNYTTEADQENLKVYLLLTDIEIPDAALPPKKENRGEIYAFNGLRGIFIAMVMLCHMRLPLEMLGIGVDGFFFMSGWLNAQSMDSSYARAPTKMKAVKNFFIHRFFRIAPAYYICIFTVIVVMPTPHREICLDNIGKIIIFSQNFGDGGNSCWPYIWSLVIEVQLYLTIPFIMVTFRKSGKLGWVLLAMLVAWKILTTFVTDWVIISFDENNSRRSINFFLGIAFYEIDKYLI